MIHFREVYEAPPRSGLVQLHILMTFKLPRSGSVPLSGPRAGGGPVNSMYVIQYGFMAGPPPLQMRFASQ